VVDGVILYQMHGKAPWYFLKETHKTKVTARLAEPVPLHQKTHTMSAAVRRKIAAAQRLRWARWRREQRKAA
jgi:hypothetical protein